MIELRPYQRRAVESIRASLRAGNRAPLAVAPTGSGKTVMFSFIARGAAERGHRITILAHRYELITQISDALDRFSVRHGLISPAHTPADHFPVQVASVQAIAARIKRGKAYPTNLLIVDEAHHVLTTNSWGRVYSALGEPVMLGVTASPIRSDGKGLGVVAGGLFDDLIDVVSVADLIDDAYLVKPIVYAPAERLDLSGIRTRAGDYEREALADRVDRPTITGDAVAHYNRICPGLTAVAFGVSIEHCNHIAQQFQEAGYRFEVIDGGMDDGMRRRLISGLGRDITGLVSCDLIGEGVDIPAIGCAILLRPTKSLGLHVQQMGRALRPIYAEGFDLSTVEGRRQALESAGKNHAFIIDHVGNSLIHGLPETSRDWTLAGKQKRPRGAKDDEGEVKVRQCEMCFAVFAPAPACPHCGHVQSTAGREIDQVDGELQRITPEMAKAIALQKKKEVWAAQSLEELQRIERARGYGNGWAQNVFQARKRKADARVRGQVAAYGR